MVSVQSNSGAGRLWTNEWATLLAWDASKLNRATLFFTPLISAKGVLTQPERTRIRRPLQVRKASRGSPGLGGAFWAKFSSKKQSRPVS